jgi:PAS domain-containing protein
MLQNLSLAQLSLLLAGTLLIGAMAVVAIYAIHRIVRRQREQPRRSPMRTAGETGFALAALQGALAEMKAQQVQLAESLRRADQKAAASARLLELVAREMSAGLMVLDREGFLLQANPALRALLRIDTWSRRRYPEIFGADSSLTHCLRECLETGRIFRREIIEWRTAAGEAKLLQLTLSPWRAQTGQIEGAVCLLTPSPPAR